jgi:hypothetical protein
MSDDRLEAVWVDRADAVPAELWAQCFGAPHEGEWLYRVLERSGLQEQFLFRYMLVRQGVRNVALAPTFLMDVPLRLVVPPGLRFWVDTFGRFLPSLRSQRTLFVGSPCGEAGRVGLVPGVDPLAALACIDGALRREMRDRGATLRVWKDFKVEDKASLDELARASGLFSVVSFPGTALDLPYASKEEYLRSLAKKQRHLFKKKVRRSQEHVNLEVEVVRRPDEATLDAIFSLFQQTYDRSKTKFERLNRRFFELMSEEPCTRFIVLREAASGEPVAFMLCFEFAGQLINKFIGLDYRRPREWLLYFRLWDAAVDRALGIGATLIQSGQTGYGPKVDLGHRLLSLTNYVGHRNPIIHRLYAAVARGIDWTTLDPALATILSAHPELRETA